MKKTPKKVLLIRLSAIGDVALSIPLLYAVARRYPDTEFTLLTRPFLMKLFINKPDNLQLLGVRKQETEKGFRGLIIIYHTLLRHRFDAVVDLHDVLRSKVLRFLLFLEGVPVKVIRKRRKDRMALVRREGKRMIPLRRSVDRYAEAISRFGFDTSSDFVSLYDQGIPNPVELHLNGRVPIGIAPFATHKGKIYPLEQMEEVIRQLNQTDRFKIYLLGGRGAEAEQLERIASSYDHVQSLAGTMDFDQELQLLSQLSLMVTMDSSNMHFAALVNVPSLSIWGATHPFAGFVPWNEKKSYQLGADLSCRPCSIYGDKACYRNDYACMHSIAPEKIVREIERICLNS